MTSTLRENPRTSEPAETVPVTVLVRPEVRAELERLAALAERSLGGEVRIALREHLAQAGREEQP